MQTRCSRRLPPLSLLFTLLHLPQPRLHAQLAWIIGSRSSPILSSVTSECIQHSTPYPFSVACTSPRFHELLVGWPLPRRSVSSDSSLSGFSLRSSMLSSSTHLSDGQDCSGINMVCNRHSQNGTPHSITHRVYYQTQYKSNPASAQHMEVKVKVI